MTDKVCLRRKSKELAERPKVHAPALLRRRLQILFGRSFHLEVLSEVGQGTTVTMRIPLQTRFEVVGRSLETVDGRSCSIVLTRIRHQVDFDPKRSPLTQSK